MAAALAGRGSEQRSRWRRQLVQCLCLVGWRVRRGAIAIEHPRGRSTSGPQLSAQHSMTSRRASRCFQRSRGSVLSSAHEECYKGKSAGHVRTAHRTALQQASALFVSVICIPLAEYYTLALKAQEAGGRHGMGIGLWGGACWHRWGGTQAANEAGSAHQPCAPRFWPGRRQRWPTRRLRCAAAAIISR